MTDEQRKKLQESNQKLRQEQAAVSEKLRAARRELEQAAQAVNYDEQAIRDKAATIGQLEGDLAIIRAKHYQDLRSIMPQPVTNATPARSATILTNRPARPAIK
jgi:Spy/CpxP family protein refolding chaperone